MNRVIEYKIIESYDPIHVESRVIMGLEKGWQPWGALTVTYGAAMTELHYSQVMVKYELTVFYQNELDRLNANRDS